MRPLAAALALALSLCPRADAVLIDVGDGTGNTGPPLDDPGWAHVGTSANGLTLLYLGHGWVLTANHVGPGDARFGGVDFPWVPGTQQRLPGDAEGSLQPDLLLFRIDPAPDLPPLRLRAAPPLPGQEVVLIGNGVGRGAAIRWSGRRGYAWAGPRALRWGSNRVAETEIPLYAGGAQTHSFATDFTRPSSASADEAQGVTGDSGGGAFLRDDEGWALGGVLLAIGPFYGQPQGTSLYGNLTYVADLSRYRSAIIALARPACSDEVDNDGDGDTDFPDELGCSDAFDASEDPACDDALDNDGDGWIDFPDDPGCRDAGSNREETACDDGLDNDGDGDVDFPDDRHCHSAWQSRESEAPRPRCGRGTELALIAPALLALRRRAG